jgi:hypothetical protein
VPRGSPMLPLLLILSFACAKSQVRQSNNTWLQGMVMKKELCSKNRSVEHTNDAPGKRIHCGLEEIIGTHILKCVCRDEAQAAQERAAAQQYMLEAAQARQLITN